MILGTAGHIDHGKTSLVRALTGVDTDRLPEEKRRGITIDLGFAPLKLADGTIVGVVDVPGHEAFVRTMLAGASGIDVGLLVIAVDEGPMPQTLEHLAILELLDVPRLVVALTKVDLVDDELLDLVKEDIAGLLAHTRYAGAEIHGTSAETGAGIEELKSAITRAIGDSRGPKADADVFRLPVDRVFSVKGTGTVVTGTVWSGHLSLDEQVRVLPEGATARVRGLQSHGVSVKRIGPGQRAAVALAQVEPEALERGATIVTSAVWQPSRVLRADVTLLPGARELRPRTRVRFHLATADVGARLIAAGAPVGPGAARAVRVVLDEPIAARTGDRFVLRSASPLATIGGGIVTDSHAPRRAKPSSILGLDPAARVAQFVLESALHGLAHAEIPVRAGVEPSRIGETTSRARGIVRLGDRWYATAALGDARTRIEALVGAFLAQHPLAPGAPRSEVLSRMHMDQGLFDHLVQALVKEGRLQAVGAELAPPRWAPALSGIQQKATSELVDLLEKAGSEPPGIAELEERFGKQARQLLRHLERGGQAVQVEEGRFYAPSAVERLLDRMEQAMANGREMSPAELREVLGFSRKFLIPFLEFCDKRGYTVRTGNARRWRGGARPG